jgi:hypothetical protein
LFKFWLRWESDPLRRRKGEKEHPLILNHTKYEIL